jgi:TolA-binding protein
MLLKRSFLTCCAVLLALPFAVYAQEHMRYRPAHDALFRAGDEAAAQLWSLARQSAREALNAPSANGWSDQKLSAEYIRVIASLKTGAPGAVDSAKALLARVTARPLHDRLSLAIARYYFLQGGLAEAIPYYQQAGIANLSNVEIGDAKFELAYCYFNNRQFAQADTLLSIMKEVPGRYYSPGNYYFGLLAYTQGQYDAALKSFARIRDEAIYRPVVPYYMAEVYYFKGEREKALAEALRLLQDTGKSYYDKELHLLAAQCLFEAGRFGEALPYFEYYYTHSDKVRKEELYEMGYAYYRVDEWANAIAKFKPLSAAQDSLGQTAMYLLGDCYLKTDDKAGARNAFGICANMPFNPAQREAALLLHAKLCYETGFSDEAMRSVRSLLQDFPGSKYTAAARLLQSQLYLETRNYKDAYEALAAAPGEDSDYGRIRQRAAFGYAMQQMQASQWSDASRLLSEAVNGHASPVYTAAAQFWKGELAYRHYQYDSAAFFAQAFLNSSARDEAARISPAATPAHASSTLGYASMQLKDFGNAQKAFAQAKQDAGNGTAQANASLREADAYFMQKEFAKAAPLYAAAANGAGADADYARLQSAIIAGLRGDDAEKQRLLNMVMNATPPSSYAAEARYELGQAQIAATHYEQALATLSPLANDPGEPELAPKALLKIGTVQQQLGRNEDALTSFRRLLQAYPSAPERADAMAAAKTIFIQENQPDAYLAMLKDLNLPQASNEEMDTAYYNAAELQYAASNWPAAAAAFRRYLAQFPEGMKATKARFYLANSLYNGKSTAAALAAYDSLLQSGWNSFSEESALRAAELSMADTAWSDASRYYQLLAAHAGTDELRSRAYAGLMRSAARLGDAAAAARYSDSLLALAGIQPALRDEASLNVIRQRLSAGDSTGVDSLLRPLTQSENAAVAAEAGYRLAQSLFAAGKLKDAEALAGANIKRSSGYELWLVKTYLLLGDISIARKDYFNARATFQSVARNARIPDLKAYAEQRLADLKRLDTSKLSNE